MSEPIRLTTPLTQDKVRSLHIGDRVLISGTIYAARDAAHKRMVETLDRGEPLPVDLRDQIVYYVGPSPANPGQAIGSAGPTTSGRMDAYAPRLMEKGLSGMIGKGNRSQAVKDAMQRYGTVYFAATGGAGALLSRCTVRIRCWPMPSSARKRWRRWRSWTSPSSSWAMSRAVTIIWKGPKPTRSANEDI